MAEDDNHARTTYVVLRRLDDAWREIAEVHAYSATAAARHAAANLDPRDLDDGVHLRAISTRAWNAGAAHLKAEHQTRIVAS